MNNKELLITTLALQVREDERNLRMDDLGKWVYETVAPAEKAMGTDLTTDSVQELRGVLKEVIERPEEEKIDTKFLKSKVRIATANDSYLADVFEDSIDPIKDPEAHMEESSRLRKAIMTYRKQFDMVLKIKQASTAVLFDKEADVRKVALELMEGLEPLVVSNSGTIDGLTEELSLNDTVALAANIAKGVEAVSDDGIMTTGYRGMNRMLGDAKGLRRGDLCCIGALQHNYKSGMLMNLAKHTAIYNKPYMLDETKKPLIVFASGENNVQDNNIQFYKSLKENETGEVIPISSIDPEEAARYVNEKMSQNGYHFKVLRFNGSDFTYRSLFAKLQEYMSQGYEIHLLVLDYLNLMSKEGCVGGTESGTIRDLFRRVRNFCNPKLITVLTAHQLSSDAKNLLRMGISNFVKEVANKGYWDSCRTLDQELDLEVIIHIEIINDKSYLTLARGKHRTPAITPEAAKYYVQPFSEAGGIRDDINDDALYMPKLPSSGGLGDDDWLTT